MDTAGSTSARVPALPRGYTARPPRLDEAEDVLALIHACDLVDVGAPDDTLEDLLADWREEGFDLDQHAIVVVDPDDRLVAYGAVLDAEPGERIVVSDYVHPEARGTDLEPRLIPWLVRWCIAAGSRLAVRSGAPLLAAFGITTEPRLDDLRSQGFEDARLFHRMLIDLPGDLALDLDPPAGVTIRSATTDDTRAVYEVIEAAFADHWGHAAETYEQFHRRHVERSDFDPTLWFVAEEDGQVLGAIVNRVDDGAGWTPRLGIRKDARGRGIAGALLRTTFAAFRDRGLPRAGLGVDSESLTGATRLYVREGMRTEFTIACLHRPVDPVEDPVGTSDA